MSKVLPLIKPSQPRGRNAYGSLGPHQSGSCAPSPFREANGQLTQTVALTARQPTIRAPSREMEFSLGPVQERYLPPYNDLDDPHLAPYWARREMLIRELAERRIELRRQRRLLLKRREIERRRFERRRRRELEEISNKVGYASLRRLEEVDEGKPQLSRSASKHQPRPPPNNSRSTSNIRRQSQRRYGVSAQKQHPSSAPGGAVADHQRTTPVTRRVNAKAVNPDPSPSTAEQRNAKEKPTETTAKKTPKKKIPAPETTETTTDVAPTAVATVEEVEYAGHHSFPDDSMGSATLQEPDTQIVTTEGPKLATTAEIKHKSNVSYSSSSRSSPSSSRSSYNHNEEKKDKENDGKQFTSSKEEEKQQVVSLSVEALTAPQEPKETPQLEIETKKDEYPMGDDFESPTSSLKEQHHAAPLSAVQAGTPEEVKHDTPKKDEYPVDDDFESSTSSLKEQHHAAPLSAVQAGTPEEVKHDTPKKDEYAADDD
ncbi:starmaker, partial [Trypanosoma rangeli]